MSTGSPPDPPPTGGRISVPEMPKPSATPALPDLTPTAAPGPEAPRAPAAKPAPPELPAGEDLDVGPSLGAPPAAPTSTAPEPTAPSTPRAVPSMPRAAPSTLAWWRKKEDEHCDEPWSHVARAMAYEVGVVLATAASVAILAFVLLQGHFQDLYVKLRPGALVTDEVALLTIGPEALYLFNPQDPVPETTPRQLLGELVSFCDAAGAEVIVLDFLLSIPSEGDEALAKAAREHGAVLAAERMELTEPSSGRTFVAGLAPALEDAIHTGFANFQVEQASLFSTDLLVRRVPLISISNRSHVVGTWPTNLVGSRQDIDQVMPSLALSAAWLHRARETDPSASFTDLAVQLQSSCAGPELHCDLTAAELGLPPTPEALTSAIYVNYRGPEHADGMHVVTAARALRVMGEAALMRTLAPDAPTTPNIPDDLREALQGKIVVIGRVDRTGTEGADRFVTPYSWPVMLGPDMAGPRIHAHVIDTLLSGRHLRPMGGPLLLLLGLLTAFAVYWTQRVVRDDVHAVIWLVFAAVLVGGGVAVFHLTDGVAIDLTAPLGALFFMLLYVHLRGWAIEESRRT